MFFFALGSFAQDSITITLENDPTDISGTEQDVFVTSNVGSEYLVMLRMKNNSDSTRVWDFSREIVDSGTGWTESSMSLFTVGNLLGTSYSSSVFSTMNVWQSPQSWVVPAGDELAMVLYLMVENDCAEYEYKVLENGIALDSVSLKLCKVAGQNELTKEDLNIFPNPTNDIVHLKSKMLFNQFSVVDFSGKQVLPLTTFNGSVISLESLNNGVYFIDLISVKSLRIRKRIIVNH
jgi:hypothetical protein